MEGIEKIAKQFNDAQEFNDSLKNYLDTNLNLGNKTPKEWRRYFKISLPEDSGQINFQTLITASAEIFMKYQQAASIRDREIIQLTVLEQARTDKYNTAYQRARDEHENKFKKGLSAKSCEVTASLAIKDIEDAISNQKLAKEFWKSTCDMLTELRKLLEMIGYALANDAKVNRDFNIVTKKDDGPFQ